MGNYLLDRELTCLTKPEKRTKALEDGSSVTITMQRYFWSWYELVHPTLEDRTEAQTLSELAQIAQYNSSTFDDTVSRWVIDMVKLNDRININWTEDWFCGPEKKYYGDEAELRLEAAKRAEEDFNTRNGK